MNPSLSLRKARAEDAETIRRIIRAARINPLSLHWQHFILAITESGRVVGTGQIKAHYDGTRELASIAVIPEYQHQGVARAIIERLLEENPPPLYLTCRASLGDFYRQFGFTPLALSQLDGYFARLFRLGRWIQKLGLAREEMLVMGLPD